MANHAAGVSSSEDHSFSAPAFDNPMGTDGFEFIEYTSPDPAHLRVLFERMGFPVTARHRSKDVTCHSQGDINFIINAEPDSFAQAFAAAHGPSICAIAFRVKDATAAFKRALEKGATPFEANVGPMELNIPAIEGIGGSRLYLVDRYGENTIYDVDFEPVEIDLIGSTGFEGIGVEGTGFEGRGAEGRKPVLSTGLTYIDHLTHNVNRGMMSKWAGFYEDLFNFREVRFFDIEGQVTGLTSRAMTSPCGKIRIPINESSDDKSQIEEYLQEYKGEGIQHIALGTDDIYRSVDAIRTNQIQFQQTPDSYFDGIADRVQGHAEDVSRLQSRGILIDGSADEGILLQIFTENQIGPIFFELIQRKGNQGFGEGNFQALFESIERDQMRRGKI